MDEALNTDSFASMLNDGSDDGQPETDPQNADDAQENSEETDPPEGEPEAKAEGEPEADPEGQPEEDPAEAFLELEINGEKVKVTKDEAKNGYLRQQDYTQKAQKLAVERQDFTQHVAAQTAEVTQYSREIGQLTNIDATLDEYAKVDWAALRNDDPMSYSVHQADLAALKAQRADVVTAIGQKKQGLEAAQKQAFAQASQEAAAHMATVVPGFGKEHVAELREYGIKAGFSAEELAKVADKRSLEVLWKAAQYDKQKATTQKVIKTVAALPTKANKPAPASKPAAQLNIEKQAKRLDQTGNVKDFATLLGMSKR